MILRSRNMMFGDRHIEMIEEIRKEEEKKLERIVTRSEVARKAIEFYYTYRDSIGSAKPI